MTRKSNPLRKIALIARQGLFFSRSARLSLILAAAGLLFPVSSPAQFLGFTSPQTVQQTLAAAGTACTGSVQNFTPSNLGQTQHYATITPSAAVTTMTMNIVGQDGSGNSTPLSDTIQPASSINGSATVSGSGYYPKIIVAVTCVGGTFTLNYSGTSATSNQQSGGYLSAQIVKSVFANSSQGSTVTNSSSSTPFGSSQGRLFFKYATAAVSGSIITINCASSGATIGTITSFPFNLVNTTTLQIFQVSASECPIFSATYTSGGASANTFTADMIFDSPGQSSGSAPCPLAFPIVIGAAGTVPIEGPVPNQRVRVCGLFLSVTTGGTLTIVEGTGANCVGGQSNDSGTMTLAVGPNLIVSGSGPTMQTNVLGNGLCLISGTAVAAGWAQVEQH